MSAPAKTRPATAPVVLTANRLRDGRVVWLAPGGAWSEHVTEAEVFPPEAAATGLATAQAAERERIVVGAYAVEVSVTAGIPTPLKFRERLRATGPSVRAEPAPQLALAS